MLFSLSDESLDEDSGQHGQAPDHRRQRQQQHHRQRRRHAGARPRPTAPPTDPCAPGDAYCAGLAAVFAEELGCAPLPPRAASNLAALRAGAPLARARERAAALAARFGSEIAAGLAARAPLLLLLDAGDVVARAAAAAVALRVAPASAAATAADGGSAGSGASSQQQEQDDAAIAAALPLLLREPALLLLEPAELLARADALPGALGVPRDQAEALARKYPAALARAPASLRLMAGRLRALVSRRGRWGEEAAAIGPSLLACYLRRCGELVRHGARLAF